MPKIIHGIIHCGLLQMLTPTLGPSSIERHSRTVLVKQVSPEAVKKRKSRVNVALTELRLEANGSVLAGTLAVSFLWIRRGTGLCSEFWALSVEVGQLEHLSTVLPP